MSVKPIRFTTDEVCATLDGHKTTKRLVVKPQPVGKLAYCMAGYKHGTWGYPSDDVWKYWGDAYKRDAPIPEREKSRHWTPPCHTDDVLWVRETWTSLVGSYLYRADQKPGMKNPGKWCPSIHMPREAARIFLRVTNVRVERLQEIDESGARAEGVEPIMVKPADSDKWYEWGPAKPRFIEIWNSTVRNIDRDRYGWAANPWVWVIEFERCKKPEEG